MKRLLRGAALVGAIAGTAYAVKSYLDKSGGTSGDEVQISFENGTSETLASRDTEEFTDIARGILGASGEAS